VPSFFLYRVFESAYLCICTVTTVHGRYVQRRFRHKELFAFRCGVTHDTVRIFAATGTDVFVVVFWFSCFDLPFLGREGAWQKLACATLCPDSGIKVSVLQTPKKLVFLSSPLQLMLAPESFPHMRAVITNALQITKGFESLMHYQHLWSLWQMAVYMLSSSFLISYKLSVA